MDAWIDVANSGHPLQSWLQVGLRQSPLFAPVMKTRTLYLAPGRYTLSEDCVLPDGAELRFERGAVIEGDVQFTVRGRIVAGAHMIFDGAGGLTVRMEGRQTPQVTPQWWGARGNGRAADGAALAAMASSIRSDAPLSVVFPPGIYLLDRTVPLPSARRYLASGAPGSVVLRRHPDFVSGGALCVCRNDSGVASRVTFRGLTFDGDQGSGALLSFGVNLDHTSFVATLIDCAFRKGGGVALEAQWVSGLNLDSCAFDQCAVALRTANNHGHIAICRATATGDGGDIVLEGSQGDVVNITESHFSGRIRVRTEQEQTWDVRLSDGSCAGLDIDAPGARVGVLACTLASVGALGGTVVIGAARQVILKDCTVNLVPDNRLSSAIQIHWRAGVEGAVLVHGCSLERAAFEGGGLTAIDVADAGGDGSRRVDVIDSKVGPWFAVAARLIGAQASFRQLETHSAGGFVLQPNAQGHGPSLTVASLQFMPGGWGPGPYLHLIHSASQITPFLVRHEGVELDYRFNTIEADEAALAMLLHVGGRLIRGPVQVEDARPLGMSGLVGDVFRPHGMSSSEQDPNWPTEWWCLRSGVDLGARWVPVCQRPPAFFLGEAKPERHTNGNVQGNSFLDWRIWDWLF